MDIERKFRANGIYVEIYPFGKGKNIVILVSKLKKWESRPGHEGWQPASILFPSWGATTPERVAAFAEALHTAVRVAQELDEEMGAAAAGASALPYAVATRAA